MEGEEGESCVELGEEVGEVGERIRYVFEK